MSYMLENNLKLEQEIVSFNPDLMAQFTVLQEENFLKNVKHLADVKLEMQKSLRDTT